jgi:hypothetical protein
MHMQPMHVYAEKEDSFINVEIVVYTYLSISDIYST